MSHRRLTQQNLKIARYSKRNAPDPEKFEHGFDDARPLGYGDLALIPEGLEKGEPVEIGINYGQPASISYLMGVHDAMEHHLHNITENVFDEEERWRLEDEISEQKDKLEQYIEQNRQQKSSRSIFVSQLKRIASENSHLRGNVQRILKATGSGRPPGPHHYHYEDGMTIKEVARRWAENHEKLYDDRIHGWFPIEEVWPHREYTWSRDNSRSGMVEKDGEWVSMEGPEKWDYLKQQMKQNGWEGMPDVPQMKVGRDGNIKLGEGNHRLAIARELGMREVPIQFLFYQQVG